jgi:chorismate mutase
MAEERSVDDGGDWRGNDEPAAAADASPSGDQDVLARIDVLRRRIDELDEQLVALLSARASCALQVGREKKMLGLEIYQPSREADVLRHVQEINPGPLNDGAIKRLFERIIDEARRLERGSDAEHAPEAGGEGGGDNSEQ